MPRRFIGSAYFWEGAPFFRPFLFLIAGITCYDRQWISMQPGMAIAILLFTGMLMVTLALFRTVTVWRDILFTVAFALFFVLTGWCSFALADTGIAAPELSKTDTVGATLVRVKEAPKRRNATTRLEVALLASVKNGRSTTVAGSALLYVYHRPGATSLAENDTLLVPDGWQAIRNSGNPFELNNATLQRRKGISMQQFVPENAVVLFGRDKQKGTGFLSKAHNWCDIQLRTYIRDSTTLGLLQAMLLGDESGFDPELRQAYAQTGVVHIVSISGTHVSVLYLVVTGVLFWIKGRRGSWIKYAAGLLLVWLYVLIAGGPPSAMRSALMFSVLALSALSEREKSALNTVSIAAFALLLYEPAWLFSVGFQLSFGAVLSMLFFYQPIYRSWYWPRKNLFTRPIWQAIAASIAAEILTAPLVAYYFHNFPLLFIFANLAAALLAGLCALVGGIAIIALGWIPPLAMAIGWLITGLVRIFNKAVLWMQGLNIPALQHLQISLAELVLLYLLIAVIALWRLHKIRYGLALAFATSCVILALLNYDYFQALKQERLIVYNNGREPSVELIRSNRYQTLAGDTDGYAVQAAHTGYHAWQPDNAFTSAYFSLKGKKILVLTDSTVHSFGHALQTDILILARPLRLMHVSDVLRTFSPKEIVIAVRPSAYHQRRWKDSCAAHNIRLHNVAESGAYIIE